jgi:predicted O-methyltransferase YrrM
MHLIQSFNHFLIHRIATLHRFENNIFIQGFTEHVMKDFQYCPEFEFIENKRSVLLQNRVPLSPHNFGAGSQTRQARTGDAIRVASVKPRYGRFLYRLAAWYKPSRIIELGTAAGISTHYLAFGNRDAEVITVEGNPQLAEIATRNFKESGLNNVTVLNSTFDEALPYLINIMAPDSLVFIDGNHTAEATLRYFSCFNGLTGKKPILVFDDINWSCDMRSAWQMIQKRLSTGTIIDLFFMGIYFDNSQLPLQIVHFNY